LEHFWPILAKVFPSAAAKPVSLWWEKIMQELARKSSHWWQFLPRTPRIGRSDLSLQFERKISPKPKPIWRRQARPFHKLGKQFQIHN